MAQWLGQFTGASHTTKVADLERSLRKAVTGLRVAPSPGARLERSKAIRGLVSRLFAARLKAVQARIVAAKTLPEPSVHGEQRRHARALQPAWQREAALRAKGVHGILAEFGVPAALWENAAEAGDWKFLLDGVPLGVKSALPSSYWTEPALISNPPRAAELAKTLQARCWPAAPRTTTAEEQALWHSLFILRTTAGGDSLGERIQRAFTAVASLIGARDGLAAAQVLLKETVEQARYFDMALVLAVHNLMPSRPLTRVVFRGGSVLHESDCGVRLGRLDDESWGLISKIGTRWSWTEGPRDEVLAVVPDAYFEGAACKAVTF